MKEPTRRSYTPSRGAQERGEGPPRRGGPSRGAGLSAEALLEMADELEEHGRALLAQARQLQRMAERMDRDEAPRAGGGPRAREGGDAPRYGGARPRGGEEGRFGGASARRGDDARGGGGGGARRRPPRGEGAGGEGGGGQSRPRTRKGTPDWVPSNKKRRS